MGLIGDIVGPIVGTGMGMLTANWQDKRQLKQQGKLQDLQIKGNKEMMNYQQGLAMDMWRDTNYSAQVEQMKKAGLNVGLMYKGAGEGGRLMQPSAQVSGGNAPSGGGEIQAGIQMALQARMLQAQIENTKADTNKKNVEANKTGGVDTTEALARIENLATQTENLKVQNEINGYVKELKRIELDVAGRSADQVVEMTLRQLDKVNEEIRAARNANQITEETMTQVINQMNTATLEQTLRITAQELGLIKTGADIKLVNQQIETLAKEIQLKTTASTQKWSELSIQERQAAVAETIAANETKLTEFNTSNAAKARQWINAAQGLITGLVVGATLKTVGVKPVKGFMK